MQAAGRMLAVLVGIVLLGFALTRGVSGDPVAVLGAVPGMTPEALAELRAAEGLDKPLVGQFADHVAGLLRGDLGLSLQTGRPVAADIAQRLPASLELALAGFVPALGVAFGLGIAAALRPGSGIDVLARGLAAAGAAVPVFVSGLLLIFVFYAQSGWAPEPSGRISPWLSSPPAVTGFLTVDAVIAGDLTALRSALAHLLLPALTMALFALAPMLRVMRAAMVAALETPAVQGARLVGVGERVVVFRYAVPEAAGALIPVAALTFGYMLGANVLVEKVFAWPGAGRYALEALIALDHAPVLGVMMVLALIHAGLALMADTLARWLDPRLAVTHA